ncbi:MAG: excinuclease ABC subunit UvrC [Bdellovibrionota bacterium]
MSKLEDIILRIETLKELVREFPTQSGVYLMKSSVDKIIYVGKAKNLRNRVKSYLLNSSDHSAKTKALVHNIDKIDYILTKTEVEAFLLEASLIKKHRPKYNIRLKDDKSYPYIKLSWGDEYPRLYLARKVHKDGSMYFGPFTSGGAVFGTIRFLNRVFKIRDCTDHMFRSRTRPCMTYQIGRCTAPCVKYIEKDQYRDEVEGAKDFLKGRSKKVIKDIEVRMMTAADEEKFEVAAKLRDSMWSVKSILEKQAVINDASETDQDIVSFHGDSRGVVVETLHVRSGRVIGARPHYLAGLDITSEDESPQEWFTSFLNQYYEDNFVPDEIITVIDLGGDLNKLLHDVLKERSGKEVVVRFGHDPKAQKLLEMADQNAKAHFEKLVSKEEEKQQGLNEIKTKLHLTKVPQRIECFDISHFQGVETVASQVVFEDGRPSKDHYRRYIIKTVEGIDDFKSMYEVLARRFKHTEYEDPDLLVVDGGKGQLSQAIRILQEIGKTDIPVVGLAKARTQADFQAEEVSTTEERFFLPGRSNPVTFKTNSEALHILTGIRDEAHRFAITFHRKRREERSLSSELDAISGLGEKRKLIILKAFPSIEAIKESDIETIAALKTFNRVLAERILLHLNSEESETDAADSLEQTEE